MDHITDIATLEAHYEATNPLSIQKVATRITPLYRQWIEATRFLVLSTVGPEGTDGSPRGDDDPVLRIADERTLMLPDWRGNNRLDSLRNIVRDGRVSLMLMVPGSATVVRVNGQAVLTPDPDLCASFAKKGIAPKTVIVITLAELYFQCAKAIMRAQLWSAPTADVPTAGQFLREQKDGFEAEAYDDGYADYAKTRMW
ncbi:MAG: pyridoxamine 5'-phosphate oxidase family protein [Pseudomonadota bacterium]